MDYWDYLGWKDPFGAKEHTARQRAYVPHLKTKGLVTPQVLVGNRPLAKGWEDRVREESARPSPLRIAAEPRLASGRLRAAIRLEGEVPEGAVVRPVLVQGRASTEVPRGENAGKTLVEYFVVRALGGPLPGAAALEKGVEATLPLPAGVEPSNLALAVLVEDPSTMRTLEVALFDCPRKLRALLVVRDRDAARGEAARKALAAEAEEAGFAVAVFSKEVREPKVFDSWLSKQRKALSADRSRVVALGVGEGVEDLWDLERRVLGRFQGAVSVQSTATPILPTAGQLPPDHPLLFVAGADSDAMFLRGVEAVRSSLAGAVETDWLAVPGKEPLEVLAAGAKEILAWAKKRVP